MVVKLTDLCCLHTGKNTIKFEATGLTSSKASHVKEPFVERITGEYQMSNNKGQRNCKSSYVFSIGSSNTC